MSCAAFEGATLATSSGTPASCARRNALSRAIRVGAMKPGRPESVRCAATARTETTSESASTAANASVAARCTRPGAASATPAPRTAATAGVKASR